MLAVEMDGQPLSRPHGSPARVVIPEMYGYRGVKWLTQDRAPLWRASRPATGRGSGTTRTHGSATRMATAPVSPRRLPRYGRSERILHWAHATAFCILLGSGLCLYLPSLAEIVGRRPLLKSIHLYTALAWLVAIALIVVLGDRRQLACATLREVEHFDSRRSAMAARAARARREG